METRELAILERVANTMPVLKLEHGKAEDAKYGWIYFAYGVDKHQHPHGVWGCRGIARVLEFKPDTSLATVRQALVNDAAGWVESCVEKGVLNA